MHSLNRDIPFCVSEMEETRRQGDKTTIKSKNEKYPYPCKSERFVFVIVKVNVIVTVSADYRLPGNPTSPVYALVSVVRFHSGCL